MSERELARIRRDLRERLLSRRGDGASEILERLKNVVDRDPRAAGDLRGEYERWRLRFDLLAVC